MPLTRSTYKYQSRAPQHTALRQRIRDLALSRVGWGYRRLTTVLKREGWSVGRKLVDRLYREENLLLRPKKTAAARQPSSSGVTVHAASTQRAGEDGFYE